MVEPAMGGVRIIGRYSLYEQVASGGMASVHLGRLLGQAGFSRTVAIKRLHPHLAQDPEFVSMLLDEARLAARVRHPNVVATLDVVALQGELLVVMEYVHGQSLAHLMATLHRRGKSVSPTIDPTLTQARDLGGGCRRLGRGGEHRGLLRARGKHRSCAWRDTDSRRFERGRGGNADRFCERTPPRGRPPRSAGR